MYSPGLGRFVSRDPHVKNTRRPAAKDGYQDGMSQYAAYFVPGSLDPYGLTEICCKTWKERWEISYTSKAQCVAQVLFDNGYLDELTNDQITGGIGTGVDALGLASSYITGSSILGSSALAGISALQRAAMLNAMADQLLTCSQKWCSDLTGAIVKKTWRRCVYLECPPGYTLTDATFEEGRFWQ